MDFGDKNSLLIGDDYSSVGSLGTKFSVITIDAEILLVSKFRLKMSSSAKTEATFSSPKMLT